MSVLFIVAGFFLGLLWFLATAAGLIWSFVVGARAFQTHGWSHRYFKTTRHFLALNLCEPLINTMVVGALALGEALWGIQSSLLITAPMMVLLVPAIGLWFNDRFYRDQSTRILRLGLARWLLNLAIFQSLVGDWAWFMLLGIPLATGLLWYSARWGQRLLDGPLATPYYTPAPPPIAASPAPAPLGLETAPPLDLARAVRCSICHTPTALAATDCPSCGLVFLSRVPAVLRTRQDYTVLRPLGSGGMSSVYLARGAADGRLCVLKTLASIDGPGTPGWRAEAAECLRREAALLAQLDHPRVARLLDREPSDAGFLALEYIAGATLEQRLAEAGAALPPGEALAYGAGVAEVLCYLADLPQPVIHCDIKPANLILPPGSRVPVLVDFGGAACVQAGAQPTVRLERYGTPGYAAPEQYQGRSSPKSDIYGLAATLYYLLTADDPSAHPLHFPALPTFAPVIASALAPALATNPDERPEARVFGARLRELAENYVVPAPAAPVPVV
jgi:hypothetical protein